MMESGLMVKFVTLGILGAAWLLLSRRLLRVDATQPFHVAAYQRDRRKARFYFLSVWTGLAATFLSFIVLEALTPIHFDSLLTRDWVLNILRGVGLWGLMTIALVWTQVGQRVGMPGSDGKSLQPLPNEKD